jgi:hypothetical protein
MGSNRNFKTTNIIESRKTIFFINIGDAGHLSTDNKSPESGN